MNTVFPIMGKKKTPECSPRYWPVARPAPFQKAGGAQVEAGGMTFFRGQKFPLGGLKKVARPTLPIFKDFFPTPRFFLFPAKGHGNSKKKRASKLPGGGGGGGGGPPRMERRGRSGFHRGTHGLLSVRRARPRFGGGTRWVAGTLGPRRGNQGKSFFLLAQGDERACSKGRGHGGTGRKAFCCRPKKACG